MYRTATRGQGTPMFAWPESDVGRSAKGCAGKAASSGMETNAPVASDFRRRLRPEQVFGLAFVIGIHVAMLYAMWNYRLLPLPEEAATVFVNLIAPAPKVEPPAPPPKPEVRKPEPPTPAKLEEPPPPLAPPPPQQLVVEAPVMSASEPVAPAPLPEPPAPIPEAPVSTLGAASPAAPSRPSAAVGPVNLSDELSVSCPDRAPPSYPLAARRRGEQGRVVLRVELDERGHIARAQIVDSSGSGLLDQAALLAVRQWHCNPAQRGGQPVRAVALQPFNFTLEGR